MDPLHWEHRVLARGPSGKPLLLLVLNQCMPRLEQITSLYHSWTRQHSPKEFNQGNQLLRRTLLLHASSLEFGEAESRGREKREKKVQRLQGSGAIKKERGRGLSGGD